jgi:hypothetical protein
MKNDGSVFTDHEAHRLLRKRGRLNTKTAGRSNTEWFKCTVDDVKAQMPITTNTYLYLSGTPFRTLASGEFIEEQIFNWTYSDEQQAKENWKEPPANPYSSLPRMVMLTYQLPEAIKEIAQKGEFDEFDLNVFFSAEGTGTEACFKYEESAYTPCRRFGKP